MWTELKDPLKLQRFLWPHVRFYKQQRMLIESVWRNDETFCFAGNMLGKDYVASFIILSFFLTRSPCRVVTTSATGKHLRVLWGEMKQFIQTCRFPLTADKGGPLVVNHYDIKRVIDNQVCPKSYIVGMVAAPDTIAAMQGHHIAKMGDGVPRTLFVADESSSVPDDYFKMARTWCNRLLAIGNTWPCNNAFYYASEGRPGTEDRGGDLFSEDKSRCYRKVVRIRAVDSPNVRFALAQKAAGLMPTNEMLIPGVKDYEEYCKNLAIMDEMEQSVSLNAQFYKGAGVLLFSPTMLDAAEALADSLKGRPRRSLAIGVDTAEGGDSTAMAAVDEHGLVELTSKKTPDTAIIPGEILAFMRKHNVTPENVVLDRGGGGKQHADVLRAAGFPVRTVAFGEAVTQDLRHGKTPLSTRRELKETRYVYVNRRAELFGELSLLVNDRKFAIPRTCGELRRQLQPIPKTYDSEGRLKLLPKRKKDPDSKEQTLTELIGCSPDEADATTLAVFGRDNKPSRSVAGAL